MGAYHWPEFLALVLLAAASHTDAGACRPASCSTSSNKGLFNQEVGHTYVYNLDGQTLSDLPEQQSEGVKLELKATAEVHFGADCSNTLKLRDVQVTGPTAKKYGNLKELEAHAVRFSFNDEYSGPELCADPADSHTALNIKRAVISLLQVSSSDNNHESDVFGMCPTSISVEKSGASVLVRKSRDLNKCNHREELGQRIMSTRHDSYSGLQSTPLLESTLACEVSIKNGVIESSESRETYVYRPFANKGNGAKTVIVTKLTLASHAPAAPHPVAGTVAKSIIFDAPHGDAVVKSNSGAVIAAMQKAKAAMPDSATQAAATEFRHLVEVFRHSGKDDLLTVYGQVKAGAGFADKVSARKLFLDALFRARTGDSVQVAVELIKSNEITGDYIRLWHANFAFMRHTTLESLEAAASLLDASPVPREAFLGVGSLAGRYCRQHECHNVKEFDALLAKLAGPIARGCKSSNHEEENNIIAALKGLENTKQLNEPTAQLLRACVSDISVPARVRVAALEAFRADSCIPLLKKTAAELLLNRQEDSEIRIKAYLAAVECPCGKCANTLKELLDSEPVNQVGSFIVSHLRNIRASNNPDKWLAKHYLSGVRTTKRFPIDVRRYSYNREFSYHLDAFNVGSSVEQNVIYSQQSYLPRSRSLNLTTEIFGHSFNLLELSSRASNLDRIVESYFGPKGFFNTHDLEELLTTGKAKLSGLREKFQERLKQTTRSRRSVPQSQLEAFRNEVALMNDRSNIDLDLNLKMFGTTIAMRSYHGDAHELTPERLIDRLFDRIDKRVEGLKNLNWDIKKHATFLETELVYPTGLGFPLKLGVTASAALHLKLDGKIDIPAIVKDPKNAHIQFEIIPSAAVEVIGEMTIDAYAVEAGTKASVVLHTATGVNVDVKNVDGTGFDVVVGLPVKKQEIVNFKTEILASVQERGQAAVETPLSFEGKRKEFHGCFDQLSPLVGLTFCGDIGVPMSEVTSKAAFYPLNGPSKIIISVEADDVSAYKFRGILNRKDPDRRSLQLLVDTPNSKTNRKLEILLEMNRTPNRELRASLKSPYKDATAELVLVNNGNEHSLTGRLINDADVYMVRVGAQSTGSDAHKTYTPLLEYSVPNQGGKKAEITVGGSVTVDKDGDSRKFTFNKVVIDMPSGQVAVSGWIAHDPTSVSSDIVVTNPGSETLTVKGKLQRLSATQFDVDLDVRQSAMPEVGVNIKWDYHRTQDQLKSNLELVHGPSAASTENKISAHALANYRWTDKKDFDFSGKGTVSYPFGKVDGKIEGNASPNSIGYVLEGVYDSYKVNSLFSAKRAIKTPGDYAVEFEAKVLDSSIKFETKRDILSETESKFSSYVDVHPGGKYELNADVTCKNEPGHVLRKIVAVAIIAGQAAEYKLDTGVEVKGDVLEAHTKTSIGSTDHVDIQLKLNRPPNPSGSFKFLVKDRIDGTGQFKYQNGAGSLAATLDLKRVNRKIKASGDLTVTGTNHVANFDLYLDHDNDQSKKVHFETATDVRQGFVDSKNTLVIFDRTTKLNVKGELTGARTDGHLIGSIDLTTPNGRDVNFKIDRDLHIHPGDTSLNYKIYLGTNPEGQSPVSIAINAKGEKINVRRGIFDTVVNIEMHRRGGAKRTIDLVAKRTNDGNNDRQIEFKAEVQGEHLMLKPLVHVTVDIARPVASYMVKLHLEDDANMLLTGKVQHDREHKLPTLVENNLEMNLPTGELKQIVGEEKWSFIRGLDGAPCQLKGFASATFNKEKNVKIELDLAGNKAAGNGKVIVTGPKEEPRSLEGSYKFDRSQGRDSDVSLTYKHMDKESHIDVQVKVPETKDEIHLTINLKSPHPKLQSGTIIFHGLKKGDLHSTETSVTFNNKKEVILTTKTNRNRDNPVVEFSLDHAGGKTLFSLDVKRRGTKDDNFAVALKMEHGGKSLVVDVNARVPNPNDFDIKVEVDSEALKINKIVVTLANSNGKTVSVTATEAGANIVDGTLDYKWEDRGDGQLYEASGNLKIRNEDRAARIKYAHNLVQNGKEMLLSAGLGEMSYDVDYKLINQDLNLVVKSCKAANTCGHAQYTITLKNEPLDYHREGVIKVDLTGLGRDADFVLKSVSLRQPKHLLHSVELQNRKQEVYKWKAEITEKAASAVLTTPKREVAAEATYQLNFDPANKNHVSYKLDANAWLDKTREPDNKASLHVEHDWQRTDGTVTVQSLSRFQHPSLGKDMVIKGKTVVGGRQVLDSVVEIDVFAKKGQKIIIDAKILKNEVANGYNLTAIWDVKSKGQNLDIVLESHLAASSSVVGIGSMLTYKDDKQGKKELGFGYQRTVDRMSLFAKSPKEVLLASDVSYKFNDGAPSVEAQLEIMGKTVIAEAHCDKTGLAYTVYRKESPDRKVQGVYQIDVSNKAVIQAEWVQGAEKKELYNLVLSWGKKSKPVLSYSLDNIKDLLEYTRTSAAEPIEALKAATQALGTVASEELVDVLDGLKKAQPNLKPVLAAYQAQLKAIRDEIDADKTVTEVSTAIRKVIGALTESLAQFTEILAKVAERALELFEQLTAALLASLKKIVPAVTQSLNKVCLTVINIGQNVLNDVLVGLQNLVELLKRHESEVKQIVTGVVEITKDVVGAVSSTVKQVFLELRDFMSVLCDQLKALPMYSMIQERVEELRQQLKDMKILAQILETVRDILGGLQESLPTEELRDFVGAINAVIDKVANKEKIDTMAELRGIYTKFCAALRSVIHLVRAELGAKDTEGLLDTTLPLGFRILRFPFLRSASVQFSPLDFLLSDDRPSLKELLLTYRPRLNPLDFIPPFKSYGILLDSSHFFTLDQRHYTFAGSCSYLLAQDVVNGNFSIVLNVDNGKFKSVQVSDDKDTIEILPGQAILVNGKPHEFPVQQGDLSAWRRYDSTNIKSKSGVHLKVDGDHHFGVFYVSGFYHGQVRGLLGDLNNEPFDDFRMPNGKVTDDVAEFGNSYNIGDKCAPGVAASHAAHAHHPNPICSHMFSSDSSLRHGYLFVDPAPFKEACVHYLSETTADRQSKYACRVAAAYVEAIHTEGRHINVPESCVVCQIGDKTATPGESLIVKAAKQADVIFIVEEVTSNADVYKDLVGPLVASLQKDLKDKGVSDVDISMIGYGHPERKWPNHYTSGGKLTFDGKTPIEFGEAKTFPDELVTKKEKLQFLRHRVQVETGRVPMRDAIMESLNYPWRAGASRTIVVVQSTGCEKSKLPLGGFQRLRLIMLNKIFRDRGITFNVISALPGFNIAGSKDAKQLKQVVGFDKHAVYSLSDAKKKTVEGNEDLRNDIEYDGDVCVDSSQHTNGATFYARNFLDAKANHRKQFLTVVSHRLVETMTDERSQECSCAVDHGIHPKVTCHFSAPSEHVGGKGKKPKN